MWFPCELLALPRLAVPRRALPRPATPCRVVLIVPRGAAPKDSPLSYNLLALPCLALPRPATPGRAQKNGALLHAPLLFVRTEYRRL